MISPQLQSALERALGYAAAEGRCRVEVEHLLLSLLETPSVVAWLERDAAEIDKFREEVRAYLSQRQVPVVDSDASLEPSPDFRGVMQRAILRAQNAHHLDVRPTDVADLLLPGRASLLQWTGYHEA